MTTAINEMLNELEAPVKENNAPAKEVAKKKEEGTPRIINIYHFSYKEDGKLIIDYETSDGKAFCRAHPALKVKPIMHQNIQAILDENPNGFKLIYPAPTNAEIAEYEAEKARRNAPKPEVKKIELTPEMIAYRDSF
jgi:hypothetical protein